MQYYTGIIESHTEPESCFRVTEDRKHNRGFVKNHENVEESWVFNKNMANYDDFCLYKQCKTEQSAQRQRQLEQGLLEMMMTVRFEDIMVSDLCKRIQIPRKSFYRYFTGKDGALHALIDHTMMEYESFSRTWQKGRNRSLLLELQTFFEFWKMHKRFLDALARSELGGMVIERAVLYAISEGVSPSRFLPGEDRKLRQQVVMFAVCGLLSMTLQWHHGNFAETTQEMAQVAKRLLNQPLFPAAEEMMFG